MVNNSTNINKTNNHLSPQQQSPLTSTTITSHLNSLNINKTTTYVVGNPGPGLGQAQKCGRIKPMMGS